MQSLTDFPPASIPNSEPPYVPSYADEAEFWQYSREVPASQDAPEPDLSARGLAAVGAWRQTHWRGLSVERQSVRVRLGEHTATLSRQQAFGLLSALESVLTQGGAL